MLKFDLETFIKLLQTWFITLFLEVQNYYSRLVINVVIAATIYFLLCVLLYKVWVRYDELKYSWKRVLLVTAHPDDECMFFGPVISKLKEKGIEIHLLCLSDGDHDGLGSRRRTELWNACSELMISDSHIVLVKDTRLPDNPKVLWPAQHVSQIILHQLVIQDCDMLVTFDRSGVSGHANHTSLFYALAYLFVEGQMPENCEVYVLDSVNIFRKYWSYFDLPISYLMSSHRFFLPWTESRSIVNAMKRHKSQMVWFRHLYVLFSRYLVINTLRKLTRDDVELELTIDE